MVLVRPPAQPITTAQRTEAQKQLRDAVVPILSTSANLLIDQAGFTARDDDEGPFGNVVKALTRFSCRRWGAADKANFSPRVNGGNAQICTPYLDSIGEGPGGPILTPLPDGGQCDNTTYELKFTRLGTNQTGNQTTVRLTGPFGGVRWVVSGSDTSGNPNGYRLEIFARRWWLPGGNPPSLFAPRWIFFVSNTVGPTDPAPTVSVDALTVLSGPDNCGDPPPLLQPPGRNNPSPVIPPSISINLPGIGPVSVTVDLDPEGNPTFCVPAIDVCVTVPIGGEDEPVGGGGDGGVNPGDIGSPGGSRDTGDGGDAEGEAGTDQVLTAIKIDILDTPSRAREFTPGVFRAVCYVYMGTPEGLDHDPAGAMLRSGQIVLAEKDNLTKWSVTANPGYNLRVTPYYKEVEG